MSRQGCLRWGRILDAGVCVSSLLVGVWFAVHGQFPMAGWWVLSGVLAGSSVLWDGTGKMLAFFLDQDFRKGVWMAFGLWVLTWR
jgi:hypothetical protein